MAGAISTRINILGALAFGIYGMMALLSYWQAPALWRTMGDTGRVQSFYASVSAARPGLGLERWIVDDKTVVLSQWALLTAAGLVFVALMVLLLRNPQALGESVSKLLARWAFAFGAVSLFALPVWTHDLWLSISWGRMMADGMNPYHYALDGAALAAYENTALAGLPRDHFPERMSYGPLWSLICGVIGFTAGYNVIGSFVLHKLILGAGWLLALFALSRLARTLPPLSGALAIAVFAWLPLAPTQGLVEGHNDILMAALALLWIQLLLQGKSGSALSFAGSVLVKYTTAPLVLVDMIHRLRREGLSLWAYVVRMIPAGLFGLAVLALFFRSLEFFHENHRLNTWRFLQPRDAINAIEHALGFPIGPLDLIASALFVALAARCVWRLWKAPTDEVVIHAAIAIMVVVTFVIVNHIWPWYLLWPLVFVALAPFWALSRFIIGVSLLAPFAMAFWWIEPIPFARDYAALVMLVGALAWMAVTSETMLRRAKILR